MGKSEQLVERLRELLAKATPRPWDTDTLRSEGEFGRGPDTTIGYDTYAIFAEVRGKFLVLFDSLNSDATEIEDESDGETYSAWDAVSRANAALITEAVNALPALLDTIDRLSSEQPTKGTDEARDLLERAEPELRDAAKSAAARGSPLTAQARTQLADDIATALSKGTALQVDVLEHLRGAFITGVADNFNYYVSLKYRSLQAMQDAHAAILAALTNPPAPQIDVETITYRVANAKLGEGPSVRCEGPTEYEMNLAREWVRRVIAALPVPNTEKNQ